MIVELVLCGKYKPGAATHLTSRRTVSVDLDKAEELSDVGQFDLGGVKTCGLGNERDGWWRIVGAFEVIEPTQELHEGKYPVCFELADYALDECIKDARAKLPPPMEQDASDDTSWNPDDPYYLVVEEWNYPTESGRDPSLLTYDSRDEAMSACHEMVEAERDNFIAATGMDCLPPEQCDTGFILTTRMGLDPYYYLARVVPVVSRMGRILKEINTNVKKARAI